MKTSANLAGNKSIRILWPQMHLKLKAILDATSASRDFERNIREFERSIASLIEDNTDASLFVLVQMLYEKNLSYSASHALLCASLCRLLSTHAELSPEELTSLCNAALTMNIGMSSLHDLLAHQNSEVTADQRRSIVSHPAVGRQLLSNKGVQDKIWLQIVQDHHAVLPEIPDAGHERRIHMATRMLQLADIFVGSISPRSTRPGLLSRQGALKIYKGEEGKPNLLGAAFVKSIGIYIPGSYVKLANGEVSVVIKRGINAHTPYVASIIGMRGAPNQDPVLRDTSEPGFEIKEGISANQVRLRTNWEELLNKFFDLYGPST